MVPATQLLVRRARQVWKAARRTLLKTVSEMKRFADRRHRPAPCLSMGQKVWLLAWDIPLRTTCPKLAPWYIGPFPITRILTPTAVRLGLPPPLSCIHPVFHISRIKPYVTSDLHPPAKAPPPPRLIDGDHVYTVRRLLKVRNRGGGRQFLVQWEGYGPEENSWIPERHVLDPPLIGTSSALIPTWTLEVPGVALRGGGTVMVLVSCFMFRFSLRFSIHVYLVFRSLSTAFRSLLIFCFLFILFLFFICLLVFPSSPFPFSVLISTLAFTLTMALEYPSGTFAHWILDYDHCLAFGLRLAKSLTFLFAVFDSGLSDFL